MTTRRVAPRRGGFSQRRKMFWVREDHPANTGSLGFADDMFGQWRVDQGLILNPPGLTIIRWIIKVSYRAVAVDDTINRFLLGLIVAPVSDPPPTNALSGEKGRDWVLWDMISWVQERQEGTPTQNLMQTESYDIRSARKLDDPERTAYFMLESQDSDTMDFTHVHSLLVKLP